MTHNEARTRKEIIDRRLSKVGWNINDPLKVTCELDIYIKGVYEKDIAKGDESSGSPYAGHLFADYVLLAKDKSPIAVVEAKKTSVDAEIGKEQARNYAQKIKENINNLSMPYVFYTNGDEIHFWDTEKYPPRKVYGFPSREDFERMRYLRENARVLSSEEVNTKIADRPYQIEAIRAVLDGIEKNRRKFLLVMATGTGKTRTCMALLDVLMKANNVQKVLFLVDRVALQEQALEAFKEHLPNAPVWPKDGEREISTDRRVYVMTYPSMLNIIEQDNSPLSPFFFDLIIADESHRSIYNVYKNIFEYFDAMQLGLTATPTDHLDHNTFDLFECEDGLPSFSYTYQEAVENKPPYLSDYEVLKIKTKFQKEGINTKTIEEADKKRLLAEGKDPEEYDFTGTELEVKVTNKGTNALIIKTFMEECIKSPDGVLPGKSIFFGISKKHAFRLCEIFNSMYPEYKGQLAEVIISEVKGVHGKGGILDRFKTKNMPRIALSVDMLDTGIDVREVVNLVFAKPVFSYTKFWQMIGRGTRILEPAKIKEWCPKKDKFLIIDCWENFEYFKIKPKGKEPGSDIPLPVRLFNAEVEKLIAAKQSGDTGIQKKVISKLIKDLSLLPENSVIVLDRSKVLRQLKETSFWENLNEKAFQILKMEVAPVMKALSGADFKAMSFELNVVEYAASMLRKEIEKCETLKEIIQEKVFELPLTVNIVVKEKETIEKVLSAEFWLKVTDDDLDDVVKRLAPLMKYRVNIENPILRENLKDLLVEKSKIEFGPEHASLPVSKYKEELEKAVKELLKTNAVLQKLVNGGELTEKEVEEIAKILKDNYPNVTEYILREVYDNRSAKFVRFLKHILDIEPLASFTEEVSLAFDEFIRAHSNYSQKQIQFLNILKSFILQRGAVNLADIKKELMNDPFTRLHEKGILGVFKSSEIDEILGLIKKVA